MFLGYTVAKAYTAPRNSTWSTRQLISPHERVGSGNKTNLKTHTNLVSDPLFNARRCHSYIESTDSLI